MKNQTVQTQASHKNTTASSKQGAGFNGASILPPSYGIDFLDCLNTSLPASQGILQRKGASFDNHMVAGGESVECAKNKSSLQRKLAIGASNDPLEQEADRVADQVMAAPTPSVVRQVPLTIQRYTGQTTATTDNTAPASVDRVLASSGAPLEPTLRQDMEQRFGHDFSQVRVHTGEAAEQSVREVNAQAYTVGRNIVFGAGQFEPEKHDGRRLLAHELTHVVQQQFGTNSVPDLSDGNGKQLGLAVSMIQRQVHTFPPHSSYTDIMPPPGEMARRERTRREVPASLAALRLFRANVHESRGFRPSTGHGAFDVLYNPQTSRVDIVVTIGLTFVNNPLPSLQWPNGTPPPTWLAEATRQFSWSQVEINAWKQRFFHILNDYWNRSHITFHCTRPYWENLSACVFVNFREASENGLLTPHNVSVYKIATPRGTNAGHTGQGGELEERDLNPRSGTGQIPTVHESGHWLGLDEEYLPTDNPNDSPEDTHREERPRQRERLLREGPRHSALVRREFGHSVPVTNDDRIMSEGMRILPEHNVTFLEGLRSATGMQEWSFNAHRVTTR